MVSVSENSKSNVECRIFECRVWDGVPFLADLRALSSDLLVFYGNVNVFLGFFGSRCFTCFCIWQDINGCCSRSETWVQPDFSYLRLLTYLPNPSSLTLGAASNGKLTWRPSLSASLHRQIGVFY